MRESSEKPQDVFMPGIGIILGAIVAGIFGFYFDYLLPSLINSLFDRRIELSLAAIAAIITLFMIPCINWWRMGRKKKVIIHLVICSFLLLFFRWLTDWVDIYPVTIGWLRIYWGTILGLLLLVPTYLVISTRIDVKTFLASGKAPMKFSGWLGLLFVVCILVGWLAVGSALNYGARMTGACKFPPAHIFFVEQKPGEGISTGLIKPYEDFSCNWALSKSIYTDTIRGSEMPKPSKEKILEYARIIEGAYFAEKRYPNVVLWQHISLFSNPKTAIEEAEIRWSNLSDNRIPDYIPEIPLEQIQGAKKIFAGCYIHEGTTIIGRSTEDIICFGVIGYNQIVSGFILEGRDVPVEVMGEILTTAISETSKRISAFELTLPK